MIFLRKVWLNMTQYTCSNTKGLLITTDFTFTLTKGIGEAVCLCWAGVSCGVAAWRGSAQSQ